MDAPIFDKAAPLNVLILTLGSHGDVHPFVGIATALRDRGHHVTLLTNAVFERLAADHGIDFEPVGTVEDFHRFAGNPIIWSRTRGAMFVLSTIGETIRPAYEGLKKHLGPNTIVVASTLGLATRVLEEVEGVPAVTVHLAPSIIRSIESPPKLPGLPPLHWFPKFVAEHFWNGADRFVLDKALGEVNVFRAELGLTEPAEKLMDAWWHAPHLTLGLWPDWFAPPASDWPKQVELVGFPLYDERDTTSLSPELDAWLSEGEPPIAFTPGSAMMFGQKFFKAAAGACERLGRRGLLLSRHVEHLPQTLPPGVRHESFAPFSQLLPRCAALVHHGGVGTLSQALSAGIPQLIMPMAHDQLDNADRIKNLGVGDAIHPRRFKPRPVATKLERLLKSPATLQACESIARRFEGVDALRDTAIRLEQFARSKLDVDSRKPRHCVPLGQ